MAPIPVLLQQWCQELHRTTLFNPFLLSLLLLFSLLFMLKFINRSGKLNLPPSPPKLPIIGNLHQLGKLPHRSLQALSDRYGPLMLLNLGYAPTLVVSSAEIAKEIMRTHDIVFANRPRTRATETFFYGGRDVAFAPQGEYWRQVRKICVHELLSLKRVQSFQFVREEEVVDLIAKIRCSCLAIDRASINLGEMFLSVSNSIVSRSVLGRKHGGEDGKKRFGELSRTSTELMGAFCFGDFFPSMGWMDVLTGLAASLKETSGAFDAFLDQVIEEHQIISDDGDQSDKKDFVEILLRLQKNGMLDINLTQDNVKAILLDIFLGGTDTTSTTMEWAMAELMKNPTLMKKAQEEVRRVVGKKAKVDENDINQMDYLKCIIKETLRLHAPLPFIVPRESSESAKLEGYDIPPKTRVFINVWAIQRDSKLWDRPQEFLPERFINNSVDFKGQDFEFVPFGSGRRICPGMSFAVVQMEYVIANLLYWFDWELPGSAIEEDLDMSEVYGIVVHKKIPLQLVPVLLYSP